MLTIVNLLYWTWMHSISPKSSTNAQSRTIWEYKYWYPTFDLIDALKTHEHLCWPRIFARCTLSSSSSREYVLCSLTTWHLLLQSTSGATQHPTSLQCWYVLSFYVRASLIPYARSIRIAKKLTLVFENKLLSFSIKLSHLWFTKRMHLLQKGHTCQDEKVKDEPQEC